VCRLLRGGTPSAGPCLALHPILCARSRAAGYHGRILHMVSHMHAHACRLARGGDVPLCSGIAPPSGCGGGPWRVCQCEGVPEHHDACMLQALSMVHSPIHISASAGSGTLLVHRKHSAAQRCTHALSCHSKHSQCMLCSCTLRMVHACSMHCMPRLLTAALHGHGLTRPNRDPNTVGTGLGARLRPVAGRKSSSRAATPCLLPSRRLGHRLETV
jgi:hypothetical protein